MPDDPQILEVPAHEANRPAPHAPGRLVVFADDWGRHPSSAQHLVRRLLPHHPTLWVNTIGTRRPGLNPADLARAAHRLGQWLAPRRAGTGPAPPANLDVTSPRMVPGFRTRWQRRLNARLLTRQLAPRLAEGPTAPGPSIAVTTLPITADLVGRLPVDRWVYYCVDDFAAWPGLDTEPLAQMETEQVQHVDRVIAAGEALAERMRALGRPAEVLTHGVDLDHWRAAGDPPRWLAELPRPRLLFWGLIDRRLDVAWCTALARALEASAQGTLILAGPQQDADPALAALPRTVLPGPVPYDALPAAARAADALVMPYVDEPVTRAMQPLKLMEYLASSRPAVVRELPATRPWAEAADVVRTPERFVEAALQRAATGLPLEQARARQAVEAEGWDAKARRFEAMIFHRADKDESSCTC